MVVCWKVIITIFLFCTIVIDGNRARRHRRQNMFNAQQPGLQGPSANSFNQQQQRQQPPNRQILNAPGQPGGQNEIGAGKNLYRVPGQGGQHMNPYQGQTGYGSVQGLNSPYAGAGVGRYEYGTGEYGQPGQELGQYGAYYNQYPGSSSFYSGYNSPGFSSNYYPSSGNYYGNSGGFWNGGQKQNINIFSVLLSSLLTLVICLITV